MPEGVQALIFKSREAERAQPVAEKRTGCPCQRAQGSLRRSAQEGRDEVGDSPSDILLGTIRNNRGRLARLVVPGETLELLQDDLIDNEVERTFCKQAYGWPLFNEVSK